MGRGRMPRGGTQRSGPGRETVTPSNALAPSVTLGKDGTVDVPKTPTAKKPSGKAAVANERTFPVPESAADLAKSLLGVPLAAKGKQAPVICDACKDDQHPGLIYPANLNGDQSHKWVERCSDCSLYSSDKEAAEAVVKALGIGGLKVRYAIPEGYATKQPYVAVERVSETKLETGVRSRPSALSG